MEVYLDRWHQFFRSLTSPTWGNYFYAFIAISLFFFLWEVFLPWRKKQKVLRHDFWLDLFYMFFNLYIFRLVIFMVVIDLAFGLWSSTLNFLGIKSTVLLDLKHLPIYLQLFIFFIVRDFTQWNTHRLLHRIPLLWQFHKVHHSVEEMGFAAHLRYHWFENVFYKTIEFIPLALLGFTIKDYFLIYLLTMSVGHFNHSNVSLPLGPLKYIFNNPQMHIWHHAKVIPNKYGVNFGLTLSIWDYLFKTACVPENGRDVPLGFDDMDELPKGFFGQLLYPFNK